MSFCDLPLDRIVVDMHFDVTDAYLERMKSEKNEAFDVVLAVEKHPVLDNYFLLVGGFDRYVYLKNSHLQIVPCFIEESRTSIDRDLKILRRFCNKGDTNKSNKESIVKRLIQAGTPFETIVKRISLSVSELLISYEFAINIPRNLITKYSTQKTLNWIVALPFDQKLKDFMYFHAGLPKNDANRLTHDTVKVLNKAFKQAPRFGQLELGQQMKIIKFAITMKENAISLLINMVNDSSRV